MAAANERGWIMYISTEIKSAAALVGEEKAVELVARAGFDAWDLSLFPMAKYDKAAGRVLPSDHPLAGAGYASFCRRLRHIGEESGICCNQSHAPYPVIVPAVRDSLKRAIECTAICGAEICVIHPGNCRTPLENAEMYQELLPFARACGVTLASENMFNWDREGDHALPAACSDPASFLAHLQAVGDGLVACLDVGHAQMQGLHTSATAMITALGPHIKALHLHDNDGRHDRHQIPFSGNTDWVDVMRALRAVGYCGYLTLEAYRYLDAYTAEDLLLGLRNMAGAARRLSDLYNSFE